MSGLRRVALEGVLRGEEICSLLVPLQAAAPASELNLTQATAFDAWAACVLYADVCFTTTCMFTPVTVKAPDDADAAEQLCAYFVDLPNRATIEPACRSARDLEKHPEEVLLPVWRFLGARAGRSMAEASPIVFADISTGNETRFLASVLGALAENASTHGQDSVIGSMLAASFDRQSQEVQIVVHDRGSSVELGELGDDDALAALAAKSAEGAPGGLAAVAHLADRWEVDAELVLRAGHGRLTWNAQGLESEWLDDHSPGFTAAVTLGLRQQDR